MPKPSASAFASQPVMIRLRTHSIRYETGFSGRDGAEPVDVDQVRAACSSTRGRGRRRGAGRAPAPPRPSRCAARGRGRARRSRARSGRRTRTARGARARPRRSATPTISRRRGRTPPGRGRGRRRPPSWPREQRDAAHRRQRQPVQEAGLDVAREVGAGVHRREERALDERHRERERDERVGREAGQLVAACSPPELTSSSIIGKISGEIDVGRLAARAHDRAQRRAGRPARRRRSRSSVPAPFSGVVAGALERAAGLREEDVVERGRVDSRLASVRPGVVDGAHDAGEVGEPVVQPDGDVARRVAERAAEAREDRARAAPRSAPVGRDRLDGRPADLGLERRRRALGDDVAVVDDPDAVGEDVGLLEVLRGQEDGDAVLAREPARPPPRARCGSGCRGRSSARRGRGCAAGARARARGRAGASSRPSSPSPCGRRPR